MTDLRKAAKEALEALTNCNSAYSHRCIRCDSEVDEGGKVASALRAALAQQAEPMQEPVAWLYQNMYTEQEYLVWKKGTGGRNWTPLYPAPPQRKPLTEEEIFAIENDIPDDVVSDRHWTIWYARAIERAHGIGETK